MRIDVRCFFRLSLYVEEMCIYYNYKSGLYFIDHKWTRFNAIDRIKTMHIFQDDNPLYVHFRQCIQPLSFLKAGTFYVSDNRYLHQNVEEEMSFLGYANYLNIIKYRVAYAYIIQGNVLLAYISFFASVRVFIQKETIQQHTRSTLHQSMLKIKYVTIYIYIYFYICIDTPSLIYKQ